MEQDTTFLRLKSDQKIRERLLEIISDYQARFQAVQGVGTKLINPFSSLDQVVRKYVNPLSLFLNEIRRQIESERHTYIESLERITLFARQTRLRDEIILAVNELELIEKDKPYFLYALQYLVDAKGNKERGEMFKECHRYLGSMNKKYQRKFGFSEDTDIIPWRVKFNQSEEKNLEGTYYRPNPVQLSSLKNVILNLSHHFNNNPYLFRFYHVQTRREITKDIIKIAEVLFEFGFTVEKIASGRQIFEDLKYVEEILNDHILSELERTASKIKTLKEVSYHISRLSLLHLRNIIPLRDFCRITDQNKALSFARKIERVEKGHCIYRRIVNLYHTYQKNSHCRVLKYFLNFIFSHAHYDQQHSQSISFGGEFSRTFIFPSYFNATQVQEKAQEEITGYSSKGKEEMLTLVKLLLNSLMNPQQFRNKKLAILGDIQSGAMGRVSIGIYQGNIVALKKPIADPGSKDFHLLLRFLKHESRIHSELIQQGSLTHQNIVECYGLVQSDKGDTMLALGYYPTDHLETLIEKNAQLSVSGKEKAWEGVTIEIIYRIFIQMIDALIYFKNKMVIHRDLKPTNVLFLTDQNGVLKLIKIIDFGVAISCNPEYSTDLFEGKTVGTLNFMAPEQLVGKESYKSDLYSLGVIIYNLLTGRVPIALEEAHSLKEKLKLVYQGNRIPIAEANPNLLASPELIELASMVEKMLELNPQNRPQIEELREKLERLVSPMENAEKFLIPIRYAKSWDKVGPEFWERATTDTVALDELIS